MKRLYTCFLTYVVVLPRSCKEKARCKIGFPLTKRDFLTSLLPELCVEPITEELFLDRRIYNSRKISIQARGGWVERPLARCESRCILTRAHFGNLTRGLTGKVPENLRTFAFSHIPPPEKFRNVSELQSENSLS